MVWLKRHNFFLVAVFFTAPFEPSPFSQVPSEGSRRLEHHLYRDTSAAWVRKPMNGRSYDCSYCGKVFPRKCGLAKHVRIHTGERPYSCHLCPMTFNQKESLTRHLREHSGDKPFHCRICQKAFTRQYYKRRHEAAHTRSASRSARPSES